MLFSRHVRRMSITRHQLKKYSDPIVKIGFERKLREVSSKRLNVMKSKSGWIQVSKRFDICQTHVEMSTLSPGSRFPAVEIFSTFNQFPRSRPKPNFDRSFALA